MESIQRWIVSVTAASILTALCRGLMPEGAARRVGGMVCALVLFVVITSPLSSLQGMNLTRALEEYEGGDYSPALAETNRALTRSLIEEQCRAYLEDKAAELGCRCAVEIRCREREGVSVPAEAVFSGRFTSEQRAALADLARRELDIEQAEFQEEGGT